MHTNQSSGDLVFVVGIDISKATFDVYFTSPKGSPVTLKLDNNAKGFRKLVKRLAAYPAIRVVMEASGPYYYALACFLHERQISVAVVNPLVIKRFSQMQLKRAKTDRADAKSIYEYGSIMETKLWQPLPANHLKIKQYYTARKQLLKHQHAVSQQLDAFQATGQVDNLLEKMMRADLRQTGEKIQAIEHQMEVLIQEENGVLKDQLESIPGVGPKTSLLLITTLRGFEDFDNYKQVISYLGLSPRIFESGTSVKGKTKICKMGMGEVRSCLYMAARSARKYNPACKALYDRLRAKGKAHKLAMIAVVNKLLKQAFAIAKSGQRFDINYVVAASGH